MTSLDIRRFLPGLAAFAVVLALAAPGLAAAPNVVATVKPVHALAADVMSGVGTPHLIIKGTGSEHGYALKPSEARALSEADLVVWVGEELETFMVKPLAGVNSAKTRVLTLSGLEGLVRLKPRAGGVWETHSHSHSHGHGHGHGHDKKSAPASPAMDGHIWLDPRNAQIIVTGLVKSLSELDPANRGAYERNGAAVIERLAQLDRELAAQLVAVKGQPFIVFHDAYQYFESRYGMNAVGSITVHPDRKPSAKRLADIRAKMAKLGARCAFSEPQYNAGLVQAAVEGTRARVGVLDAIGAELAEGPDAYFAMMRGIARSLADCLGATN